MKTENHFTNNQDNFSPGGSSLEKDFRKLINDKRFHDFAIKCSDGKPVYGCKAILATRSDVFDKYIFNKSAESKNNCSFKDINSSAMKVILEFLYTSKVESLTFNNAIEVYYASIHFKLIELQDHIIEFTKSLVNGDVDIGRKLLSECVEKFTLKVDNKISHILVDWVAKNKLEKDINDSLSLKGLRYLLEKTFNTKIPFATPEFNIWEYSLTKAIRKVMKKETLVKEILNKNSFSICNPQQIEELNLCLTPLISYIDLNRMNAKEIKQQVAPFNIYSDKKISDVYYSKALNEELEFIRGAPIFKWKNNGMNKLFNVPNNGFTVTAFIQESVLGDLIFKGKGVYEWNILIEKLNNKVYIGICDINVSLNKNDQGYHGWVLGSDGYVYHEKKWKWYDAKFKEGDKVTIHLNMKNGTCAFSVNNIRKPTVSEWNISSQVSPIVSLGYGSKLRIE
ncbi:hypothetical protein RhiirA5_504179 [Rhizophagus irregularis]|uniref:BTB domain-containing protein n=1 Tax=Rhizophagus irregularis TaxID=588596 RepID=A0A2N0P5U4_9GLOM|nr:hypothetical protein RhiirA5_504179 [Rhizophagus irregularis]CAB5164202.1 unnamed protein product [Rhizophagus irregularis]CAB5396050.1 unnamed protein product [Rhizophagus irregularis]